MAWAGGTRSFKDASSNTRQAVINATATAGEDVFLHSLVYGTTGSDPNLVLRDTGLPVVPQMTLNSPTTDAALVISTASSGATGNAVAVGGTGGTARPGVFLVTADPDNADLLALGDTTANAAVRSGSTVRLTGAALQPGQAIVIATNDLRAWKVAARIANDALQVIKVGTVGSA